MELRKVLGKRRLYLDGGMGTMLQRAGLGAGELPEVWNLTHPDVVTDIHAAYLEAGANIVTTNTFGAYRTKFSDLDRIIPAALANARAAADRCGREDVWVAYDVGPLGRLLEPMGDLPFEEAVSIFAQSIGIAAGTGLADLILIETMNDAAETRAAVLAARECCTLPIFVTNVFDAGGHLLTGSDCAVMAAMLDSLGVDAVGLNCSLGPHRMAEVAKVYAALSPRPLIVSPNAGLPHVTDGRTVYDVSAEEFAAVMADIARQGGAVLGGCCGTDPDFIRKMTELTRDIPLHPVQGNASGLVSSPRRVSEGEGGLFPLGNILSTAGLEEEDLDDLVDDAMDEADEEGPVVTLDLSHTDPALAERAVRRVQELVHTPLALMGGGAALEAAVRAYTGKALIVADSREEGETLARRYGGLAALPSAQPGTATVCQ